MLQQYGNVPVSNCTGRRRALLVGINYKGQQGELRGCINDVHNIKRFLMELHHFRECDMVILTDDQQDPRSIPTRANMIAAMRWLVNGAQPNDSYFFHFSGHGGQVRDADGDESDGFDETILPLDYKRAGQIVDDEINAIMVRPLPPGCRLTAIFDSCHSGTAMDLPFLYDERGQLVKSSPKKKVTQSLQQASKQYLSGNLMGAVSALTSSLQSMQSGGQATKITQETRASMGDVIMFSGCMDSQTSADTSVQGYGATGAMSYAFITTMRGNPQQTYTMLLGNLREILRGKYSQKPQMSTGRPMDMNTWFIM
ncbi:peptidase C14, caspase domain-containing protein [Syncephalis pseudoplumigaleata]|uniref:Peptidase C14, caspase domain-containing protein n=1 Tax=Syncephalis pseudoplumigaleata TaxID=1712513 RepID=A0A4V1J1D4_9FUNG|nr:peptidase C14, caspase domain-containing protein [Syncephalis pseudoplumigaleata]|eukprot:RKP24669.1 peptidase C14, caspase domain-containing protein [Syncephalis pseudoplumigaleata]